MADTHSGLLAFLFQLNTSSVLQERFHKDAIAVMNEFQLSTEIQQAIRDAGSGLNPETLQKVVNYLVPELAASYNAMW